MEQRKNNTDVRQPQSDVEKNTGSEQGRVAGSNKQTDAEGTADISQVDQQEGHMNRGETGGNFATSADDSGE